MFLLFDHPNLVLRKNFNQKKGTMSFTEEIVKKQKSKKSRILREVEKTPVPLGIAFEGGGICGLAHIGVCKYLEDQNLYSSLKFFSGASAGSMIAGLVACRVPFSKLKKILLNFDFESLNNSNWLFIGNAYRLLNHYGWSDGQNIEEVYGKLLKEYVGDSEITLGQIKEKFDSGLIISATSWKKRKSVYYAFDTHPDMKLKEAVRRSASYPINFSPAVQDKDFILDGGVLDNYPLRALYPYCEPDSVIGCKLISNDDPDKCPLIPKIQMVDDPERDQSKQSKRKSKEVADCSSLVEYLLGILEIYQTFALRAHVHSEDWARSLQINVGNISILDFKLSTTNKKWLVLQGFQAAQNYFSSK